MVSIIFKLIATLKAYLMGTMTTTYGNY